MSVNPNSSSPFLYTNIETSFVYQDKRGFFLEQILPLWYDQFDKLEAVGVNIILKL